LKWVGIFALTFVLSGCYSFSASALPAHIRTLTVQPVGNRTFQSLLSDQLMRNVESRMRRELPRVRQMTEGGDARLSITLTGYSNAPASFNRQGTVSLYEVTLTVDVQLRDRVKKKDIYMDRGLRAVASYDIGNGETEDAQGQTRALEKLLDLIVNNALSDW
jgi:hypothetical protein